MSEQPSKLEAVRQAKESLGEASADQIAAFVEGNFGMKIKPAIVTVLLASLKEREALALSRRKAHDAIERMRAEKAKV